MRFAAMVVAGGLVLAFCLAALFPGARQIALAHHYTATIKRLGDLSQPTLVYDDGGNQIGKLGIQDREPADLSEVPQILINAVIATEDKTFWKNPGIDVGGVSRAFVDDVTTSKISQGGSTITQQLVKNRILGNKRDLQRKAKELVLAYRMNEKYSKREILDQYLNTVYFGQGSYRTGSSRVPLVVSAKTMREGLSSHSPSSAPPEDWEFTGTAGRIGKDDARGTLVSLAKLSASVLE
jgi:membrane peptidoglycan carboxypeptidase